ncbi:MAG: S9 family peptidase [Pseudomonadota bacterium]
MRKRYAQAAMIAAFGLIATGTPAAAESDPSKDKISEERDPAYLAPKDVFDIEYAADPQIAPDGSSVAYVRRWHDIMTDKARSNVWIVKADGSGHRPVASGRNDFGEPRWSPDGNRLAYVSGAEGSPQIYVRWMDTGDVALVTNLTKAPRELAWSPDGETIAFVMDVPVDKDPLVKTKVDKPENAEWAEPFKVIDDARFRRDGEGFVEPARAHIFVVPADGGAPRQLTSGDFNHDGPLSWTPAGDAIVFAANRHEGWALETVEADIFAISLDGELTQLTDMPGAESAPVVSPKGDKIAFLRSENKKLAYRLSRLYVMDTDGSNAGPVAADFNRRAFDPAWAADGSGVYFTFDDHGARHVGFTDLAGERREVAKGLGGVSVGRPYLSGGYTVARDGAIAFTKGRAHRPSDVAIAKAGATKTLTDLNEDLLGRKKLGKVTEIVYKSSLDGRDIQGWYVTPPDFDPKKKYPLILEIHGGPHLAYGPTFSLEIQRYAAEGYVVFYDNHRGSSSYGEEFGLLLQHKYPGKEDFQDHMDGVDAVIAKGFVDPERLFIAGGSAGGVATAYAVGLTGRFKAAVAAKPIINWTSKVLTADSYIYQSRHQFPGLPWEEFEHYWARSPLSLAGNVTTPTMLMTGEEDYRTPITESEQFYQALTLRGIDTVLVRVPGSGHGIAGRPSRLINKVEHTLAWFARYDPAKEDKDDE